MNITTIGMDIAKEVYQVCGVDAGGKIVMEKRLSRKKVKEFFQGQASCCVVMEACGGANYWVRELRGCGHEVKLIAPQYVKPFVKGNKNDSGDARAIVEAASRPQMRYVTPKTVEQQDMQSLLRIREGYVANRTQLVNQVRGLMAEYGLVTGTGVSQLRKQMPVWFDRAVENGLSGRMKELIETQYEMLLIVDERIDSLTIELSQLSEQDERCKRLKELPGVGPITSVAIVAQVGKGDGFENGRHFAAYVGLVPRQHSSGGREQLLGISKRGDACIRRLLIHGARSALIRVAGKNDSRSRWMQQLIERRGMNRACVAVANKNARIAMSMLLSGEHYRVAA